MFSLLFVQVCVIVSFYLNIGVSSQWIIMEETCESPDGSPGTCIPIKTCPHVIDILQNSPKPYSQKIIDLLRRYQCGYDANDSRSVNVCCPNTDSTTVTIASTTILPVDPIDEIIPTDVSNHQNLALLPEDCGTFETDDKIIGGNKTALNEFPWMALISYRKGNRVSFRCGGSIINEKYILTAAHCVTNLKGLILNQIRVGEHNILNEKDCQFDSLGQQRCAPPVQDFEVEKVTFHPLFNTTTLQNDIAVIKIAGIIDLSLENAKAICLPHTKQLQTLDLNSRKVFVTGWGTTEEGTRSDVLLKVLIPIRDHAECTKIYQDQVPVWHKQICAGGMNRQDSCGGDSGGPMQNVETYNDDLRYVQFGVVSFGPKLCGLENSPGVYTSVRQYLDWILNNISS